MQASSSATPTRPDLDMMSATRAKELQRDRASQASPVSSVPADEAKFEFNTIPSAEASAYSITVPYVHIADATYAPVIGVLVACLVHVSRA